MRDYWNEEKYEETILTTLFEDHKYSFTGLQATIKSNSGTLRKYLDALKEKGLVSEKIDETKWKGFNLEKMAMKSKNWKTRKKIDNRPTIISLTKKGQKECILHNFKAVQKSIEKLEKLTSFLVSNQDRVEEWLQTEKVKIFNETLGKVRDEILKDSGRTLTVFPNMKVEQSSDPTLWGWAEYIRRSSTLCDPLVKSMQDLNRMLLRLSAPKETSNNVPGQFITVFDGSNTEPHIISTRFLEGINFYALGVSTYDEVDWIDRKIKWTPDITPKVEK